MLKPKKYLKNLKSRFGNAGIADILLLAQKHQKFALFAIIHKATLK